MATRRNDGPGHGLKGSRRGHLLALEPRMMFDAAVAATNEAVLGHARATDAASSHDIATPASLSDFGFAHRTLPADAARPAVTPAATAAPADREIIFIDEGVENYRQLAAEWASRGEVVLIDDQSDGVAQVEAALAGQTDISAIHIVSHGEEGAFFLGTTRVDQASIAGSLSAELAQIGTSLAPGGDILLYGCDFAEGSDGAAALRAFATATGADVAASTDLTGAAARGGDWTLEAHDGAIQTRALSSSDYHYVLAANTAVPIAVTPDSLTVTDGSGKVIVSGATGYTTTNGTDRSADVGVGATARWTAAATLADGTKVDLIATVASITTGDFVRFNRPTSAANGDDPTFLLRDASNGSATNGDGASVQIVWSLVLSGTDTPIAANVEFGILDIDGVGGKANTRESVVVPTDNLAYYTAEQATDIAIAPSLSQVAASGTQNENTVAGQPLDTKSEVTFDWTKVSTFDITYNLAANNGVTTQAQFYQDGNADFTYADPVSVSIPRLDLDADDSTAPGNDAHFTYTEDAGAVPIVDSDVVVANPMDTNSIVSATVVLTNAKAGDVLDVGALPSNIAATVDTSIAGRITVTLADSDHSDNSQENFQAALQAITFSNTLAARPDTTQRVIDVSFTNGTLTSATAVSRIDVVDVDHAPTATGTLPDQAAKDADAVSYTTSGGFTDIDGDTLTYSAAGLPTGLSIDGATGVISGTLDRSASQVGGGIYTVVVTATDPSNASTTQTFHIDVTNPPPVAGNDTASTSENMPVRIGVLANDVDPDGDPLTVTSATAQHGTVVRNADGTITYTPDQYYYGSDTIDYSISDGQGGTSAATVAVAVAHVNQPPVAHADSVSTSENVPVTVGVLANDTDPDGDPLTVTSASAQHGTVVRNADGTITYTPNRYYYGADTISYAISDGNGGTSTATVAVTVAHVDQPPHDVGTIADRTANDADTVSYATAAAFDDPDRDTLTYSATGLPAGLAIDSASGVISGTIDRSASQVGGGVYTVQVTAADPSSAASTQTFRITVANPPPVAHDDSASTNENVPVTIAVLANDVDPDGDPLGVIGASAQHGTVVRNADDTLTYTPNQDYFGSDTISYAISDGQGGTSSATVAVAIAHVDQAPSDVATLPQRSTVDSATISWATAGGFADVDGDTLAYSASGLPAGLTIDAATGVISGTLGHSDSQANGGRYAVVVTATDPSELAATQSFAVAITNPAPHAGDDRATVHVDTPADIVVLANDSDPDGDPIAVTAATAAHGTVSINADGTLHYTPDTGFSGADTIAYTITDGDGATGHATVAVTVSDAAPTATPIGNQAAQDGQVVSLPVGSSFADPDRDTLRFSATGLPAGLAIDPATGIVSGTIDRSASQTAGGVYDSVVTADDGHGGVTSEAFHWTITNPAPIAHDDGATTPENSAVVIAPLANDVDPDGDPLSIDGAAAPHGQVAINPDGTMTYTPDTGFVGTDTIAYTITDNQGGHSAARVSVTVTPVDQAPSAVALAPRSDHDNGTVTVPTAQAFDDPDGDTLTYSATGLPAGVAIDPATGIISGTLGATDDRGGPNGDGRYPVTIVATDPSGLQATSGFVWSVTPTGLTAQDDRATTPQATPVTIDVLANDSDDAGTTFTVTDATAYHGQVAINPDGTLGFTPDAAFHGDATISYTITDSTGNKASATVAVTVTQVDHAPVASAIPPTYGQDAQAVAIPTAGYFSDPDGDALTYSAAGLPPGLSFDPATGLVSGTIDHSASQVNGGVYHVVVTATDPSGAHVDDAFDWTITNPAPTAHDDSASTTQDTPTTVDVLRNDVDPDGDALTVTSAHAGHGTVAIDPDGTITYTPNAGYLGQDVITYAISDGQGGRSTASVDITVVAPEHTPVANPDTAATRLDTPVAVAVLANDSDPDGDPLTVTSASAQHGAVAINPDGTITYTPDQGYAGADSIAYTVSDGHGGATGSTVAVTITPDRPPVANPDTASTRAGSPVAIAVLANDTDADGDPLTVTGATAQHGTVAIDPDGTLTYTPDAGYSGADTIGYAIGDGHGGTDSSTVAVSVLADTQPTIDPRPPVDTVSGRPVTIDGLAGAHDADGDPLALVSASAAAGTVVVNPDNTITYTPARGFVGTSSITYTVADGQGGSATATIVVRVAAAPASSNTQQLLAIGRGVSPAWESPPGASGDVDDAGIGFGGIGTAAIGTDGRGIDPLRPVESRHGFVDSPFPALSAVDAIRSLNGTTDLSGETPVGDAVEGIRSLDGIYQTGGGLGGVPGNGGAAFPVSAEVARLGRIADFRDAAARLYDHRWGYLGDFGAHPFAGFSEAADQNAGVMIETLVQGGAIYVDVRDTAPDAAAAIRSVDVTLAGGGRPDWIAVDHRGFAIVEAAASDDEIHLLVSVTRADGSRSATPVVIQRATGEIELDRHGHAPAAARIAAKPASKVAHRQSGRAAPLDATLHTPHAAAHAAARTIADTFQ